MDQTNNRDDALFEALEKKKKKKKRKVIRTVIIVVLVLAVVLVAGIFYLRRQVAVRFAGSGEDVTSAEAVIGSISTQVSGSGTLMNVDEESLTAPAGVTVDEVLVSAHDNVTKGQLLVKTDATSVLTAMNSLEEQLSSIDSEITDAADDTVDNTISSGVAGRVKQIFAQPGDDVSACMYDHGALAVLSLDGKLSATIETDRLRAGDSVSVRRPDGTELNGTVDSVLNGKAVVLVPDSSAAVGESMTALDADGNALGSGELTIHSPLRITGISGTVTYVHTAENQNVYANSPLFSLKDTSYTAKYQSLVKQREELEDDLLELMEIYRSGGITAPFTGSVSSVDYDETAVSSDDETALVTLSPDIKAEVTINVDESNILSLELGQTATVTIASIGDDVFRGSVTEINKTASSASGVTRYSAVVTLDKAPEMLQGMTAKVVIRIEGVENAVIIPVEAVHQTSSRSFVYTSYDEELKEFGGLTEVTVGITNSNDAEITSGLKEGDTVWYTKAETNPFANMGMPGGSGGFPSGSSGFPSGDRPDMSGGGFPGGGSGGSPRPGSGDRPSGGSGGFPGGGGGFPGGA